MSPTEINAAIAEIVGADRIWMIQKRGLYYRHEAAGYTDRVDEAWKLPLGVAKKYEYLRGDEPVTLVKAPVPDYFHDLNAIHEAEKTLSPDQCWLMSRELDVQCGVTGGMRSGSISERTWHATPPQRCEAFLRAHGKWRDE